MQAEPGSRARQQHHAQLFGPTRQKALERRQRVVRVQLVQIVDDQHGGLPEGP
jgi:hypothetical protein